MALQWLLLTIFLLKINIQPNCAAEIGGRDTVMGDIDIPILYRQRGSDINDGVWSGINTNDMDFYHPTSISAKAENVWVGGWCHTIVSITFSVFTDYVYLSCSTVISSHNSNGYVLVVNGPVETNSVYRKPETPDQLQVIKDGQCSIRTYRRPGGRIVGVHSDSPVTGEKCEAMKREHREAMLRLGQRRSQPCYPYCNYANSETFESKLKPKPLESGAASVNTYPHYSH